MTTWGFIDFPVLGGEILAPALAILIGTTMTAHEIRLWDRPTARERSR
jgi:hypothetical protein